MAQAVKDTIEDNLEFLNDLQGKSEQGGLASKILIPLIVASALLGVFFFVRRFTRSN